MMSSLFNVPKGAFTNAMPLNLQNQEQNKSHKVSPFPHTQLRLSLCVEYVPYSPSTLACPFITVIKYLSKTTGSGEGLSPLIGYSPSLMESGYMLSYGMYQAGTYKQELKQKAMRVYCLLVYSLWLARPDFLYHQGYLSGV